MISLTARLLFYFCSSTDNLKSYFYFSILYFALKDYCALFGENKLFLYRFIFYNLRLQYFEFSYILSQFWKLFLVQKLIYSAYFWEIDPYDWLRAKFETANVISKEIRFRIFQILTFLVFFIWVIGMIIHLDIVVIVFLLGAKWGGFLLEKLAAFVLVVLNNKFQFFNINFILLLFFLLELLYFFFCFNF